MSKYPNHSVHKFEPSTLSPRPNACAFCDMDKAHEVHGEAQPKTDSEYLCAYCDESFYAECDLMSHAMSKHPEKLRRPKTDSEPKPDRISIEVLVDEALLLYVNEWQDVDFLFSDGTLDAQKVAEFAAAFVRKRSR